MGGSSKGRTVSGRIISLRCVLLHVHVEIVEFGGNRSGGSDGGIRLQLDGPVDKASDRGGVVGVQHGRVIHIVLISNGQLVGEVDLVARSCLLQESLQVLISVCLLKLGLEALVRVHRDVVAGLAPLTAIPFLSGRLDLAESPRLVALKSFIRYMLGHGIFSHKDLLLNGSLRHFREGLTVYVLRVDSRLEALISRDSLRPDLVRYGPAHPVLRVPAPIPLLNPLL